MVYLASHTILHSCHGGIRDPRKGGALMATIGTLVHGSSTPIRIPIEDTVLYGDLRVFPEAVGIVVFVHGSGSSRFSPRNRHVAEHLNAHGLATLLLDLLTKEEQQIDSETMEYRFDIAWLAARTQQVFKWVRSQAETQHLPVALFGASTGAAAALMTAAAFQNDVAAVVSRGGRPDLAEDALHRVQAPTLFIVGESDEIVLALNRNALQQMNCTRALQVIPGATHLFEEPGALEAVAEAASDWFTRYIQQPMSHDTAMASTAKIS
jgi:putative phosphoribosyl transferase